MSETILFELKRLVNSFGKYHAERINSYYEELMNTNASPILLESFVSGWISRQKQFPAYSDIVDYLEQNKCNTGQNREHYSKCGLCGNTKQAGMWELLRSDGQTVAAACICNKEQSKIEWDKYDPNNPPIFNGEIRYMELSSF